VTYANLAPASYRFLVRAIDTDGVASLRPASISFIILPPIWLRWWFLLLAGATIIAAFYSLYRYRIMRLLELEQVRTRIATDLHDDIGSSLSQIAILSEIANRRVERSQSHLAEPLADIAGISRELVDSMSDIVWSTDPERDYLRDLVQRMRRFASDILSPREIRVRFQFTGEGQDLHVSADVRRQIYLVFKEAVHNLVRHSGATEARIDFRAEHGWLNLTIADNGGGFDLVRNHDGHGLRSMRERARQVNGVLEVAIEPERHDH
jgi:signal transduction histidine kinase